MNETTDWIETAFDRQIERLGQALPALDMPYSRRQAIDAIGQGMVMQIDSLRAHHRRMLEALDPLDPDDAETARRRLRELDHELELCLQHGLTRLRELGQRCARADA